MTIDIVTMPIEANGHQLPAPGEVWIYEFGEITTRQWQWQRCAVCGEAPKGRVVEGRVLIQEPCAYPEGITTVTEVAFPSGKIIVTDDLRPVFEPDERGFADYNSSLGQAQYIQAMAALGCAYGPVRNNSPYLYRLVAPGQFVIATPAYSEDEDDWGDEEFDLTPSSCHGAEKLAPIYTDLWAYSIADYGLWKSLGGDEEKTLRHKGEIVDITPGVYRFTHHTGERGFDWDADELIFAHVERIG